MYLQHKHKFRISCEAYLLSIGFSILYHPSKLNTQGEEENCMIIGGFFKYLHITEVLKDWPAQDPTASCEAAKEHAS